jgi:hypothetical protein
LPMQYPQLSPERLQELAGMRKLMEPGK